MAIDGQNVEKYEEDAARLIIRQSTDGVFVGYDNKVIYPTKKTGQTILYSELTIAGEPAKRGEESCMF